MSTQIPLDASPPVAGTPRARRRPAVQQARDFLAAWVPFTDAFGDRARAEVRTRMQDFRALQSVDAATREALDDRVAALELRLARLRLRRRATLVLIGVLSLLAFGAYAYLVVPAYLITRFDNALTPGGFVADHPVIVLALFAAALGATAAGLVTAHRLLTQRFGKRATTKLEAAALVVVGVTWLSNGVLNAWSISAQPVLFLAALYLCGTVVFVCTAAATWLVIARANRLYRARAAALWPDSVVMHELLAVLSALEQGAEGDRWMDLDVRRELLRRLESAATAVELHLPRRLWHDDPASEGWLRQEAAGIAAALRDLKRGLCLPDASTHPELVRRLSGALVHAVRGEWNRLERAEVPPPAEKRRRTRGEIAVRVLLAVGALAVVGGILWLDRGRSTEGLMKLAGEVAGGVSGLLIPLIAPLAAYTLLRAINPSAIESLSAVKQFAEKK
ncbi:MAG TPA: hypothetical protein VFX98_12290 [Longimicrobiaceae bacterium]|nr:hypothetical protein [Longimicrobiaceae bacterium]